jgi:phosphoglycerol transferase MdoB-like AlkP superfamily enzyme
MQPTGLKQWIHSRMLRWALYTGLLLLAVMTLLRLIFFLWFKQMHLSWGDAIPSFVLGLRYDLRMVCVLMLVMILFGSIKRFNPYESPRAKRVWFWLLDIITITFIFFYIADFGHYAYLTQRLNASVLGYMQDAGISLGMVWQTYPVVKIVLGLIVFAVAMIWAIKKLYRKASPLPIVVTKKNKTTFFMLAFLVFAIGIFGRIGQYPLRWSFAFAFGDDNKANLALNPIQSFFSTLKFRKSTFNIAKTRSYYSLVADQLGVAEKDSLKLNFVRNIPANDSLQKKKSNIIIIICESFSSYKSSMWGNPLNTTPYFQQLCDSGVFFRNFFSPCYGTARGVWATVTGIPDVEQPRTASRNMAMVSQRLTINDFKGYEKKYFLGGSASWANIRGLLQNNIRGIKMYEGDAFKAPKVDVWGISDKNLFLESIDYLTAENGKPFFAIIQTAANHRPYTIAAEDKPAFKVLQLPQDTLVKYGFTGNDEFNAFRYTDFAYKAFIEKAKQQPWFDNTIFIFLGDHGVTGDVKTMFPKAWTDNLLTNHHVPLLFYAPRLLKPENRKDVCSQTDVVVSAAALAGIPHHNYTLGKNLFASITNGDTINKRPFAFLAEPDLQAFGIIDSNYYYSYRMPNRKGQMVSIKDNKPVGNTPEEQQYQQRMHTLAEAYYETARYMLFNNKNTQQ